MAKVLAVLAALVLGAEAGLTASGGNCADSDEGLCRMPEVAAKVALEVTAAGTCTDAECPCWALDAYKTDAAAFEDLKSYSGGCATDETSADCVEVTAHDEEDESRRTIHWRRPVDNLHESNLFICLIP